MSKKRILFIVNPISGTGKKDAALRSVEKYLDTERFYYEIRPTTHAGHAAEMADAAARSGIDIVAAVGGDGTVNEVARSLVHTPTALAIIPCGSGNGLARHLQIPMQPARAVRIINRATIHSLDYGRINGRPFFCTCGVGFDAFVSLKFAAAGRRGPLSYVENTVREGLTYRPETYKIQIDGNEKLHEAFLIACANASQYGNNAFIAPHASMKDGLMDVIIISPFALFEAPQIALGLFNKRLADNSHVEALQARHIRITRPTEGAAHCDGDPFMTGRTIEVELIRNSFNVVVNPEAHTKHKSFIISLAESFSSPARLQAEIMQALKNSGESTRTFIRKLTNR